MGGRQSVHQKGTAPVKQQQDRLVAQMAEINNIKTQIHEGGKEIKSENYTLIIALNAVILFFHIIVFPASHLFFGSENKESVITSATTCIVIITILCFIVGIIIRIERDLEDDKDIKELWENIFLIEERANYNENKKAVMDNATTDKIKINSLYSNIIDIITLIRNEGDIKKFSKSNVMISQVSISILVFAVVQSIIFLFWGGTGAIVLIGFSWMWIIPLCSVLIHIIRTMRKFYKDDIENKFILVKKP